MKSNDLVKSYPSLEEILSTSHVTTVTVSYIVDNDLIPHDIIVDDVRNTRLVAGKDKRTTVKTVSITRF